MNNYLNDGFNMVTGLSMGNFEQEMSRDNTLSLKLAKQAGDNMNFNKCGYNGNSNPNNLYDIYNGFIRGNMFPDLYNQYKIAKPFDVRPMNEQAELLTKVDAYCFAAHDVALYLDTHPNDQEMIRLYDSLNGEVKKVTKEYENKFGPLLKNGATGYPWTWNNSPWPWEK